MVLQGRSKANLKGKQTTLFLMNKQDHAFQGFQGTIKSKSGDIRARPRFCCYTTLDFLPIFQSTNTILEIVPP
jgi:hypothetical protein